MSGSESMLTVQKARKTRVALGSAGEDYVARWYERQGFCVVARNVRIGRGGELDLIVSKTASGSCGIPVTRYVFVEVKTRQASAVPSSRPQGYSPSLDNALEMMGESKLQRMWNVAQAYLVSHGLWDLPHVETRFDLVAVLMPNPSVEPDGEPILTHYEDILS